MQTALQKIGEHFENTLSTSGGQSPPFTISQDSAYYQWCKSRWKKSPSSNRDCVATSEAHQTPLYERLALWWIYYRNHRYDPHLSTQIKQQQDDVQKRENWITVISCGKTEAKNTHLVKTVSLPIKQGPEA